MILNPSRLCY